MTMKYGNKIAALILIFCMTASMIAGCGNQEAGSVSTQASGEATTASISSEDVDWDEDPAQVNWFIWAVGASAPTQAALERIEEKINEITLKEINTQVKLTIMEMGTYLTQMPMQVTAGDKMDLITTFPAASGTFTNMASSGQLLPLNDLVDTYCQDLKSVVSDNFFDATTIEGNIYGVPVYTDYTYDLYWLCREDILKETGISIDDIHSYEDLPAVFDAVKNFHPEMKMVSSGAQAVTGSVGLLLDGTKYDALTNVAAVFYDNEGGKAQVVNLFETEAYQKEAAIYRQWEEAGYVDQDILIRETSPTTDNTVFSWFLQGNNSRIVGNEALSDGPLVYVKMGEGPVTTKSMANVTMAIPVSATEPEAAAKLMNLLYTNAEMKNLVNYGIEGEDYTLDENGGVVQAEDAGYAPNTNGLFGNVFLSHPTASEAAAGLTRGEIDQSGLPYSPFLGFTVNLDAITNEAAQLDSIIEEYGKQVKCGMADEATYKAMIDKMHASGLDTYLAEIQRQLDEWLASK